MITVAGGILLALAILAILPFLIRVAGWALLGVTLVLVLLGLHSCVNDVHGAGPTYHVHLIRT